MSVWFGCVVLILRIRTGLDAPAIDCHQDAVASFSRASQSSSAANSGVCGDIRAFSLKSRKSCVVCRPELLERATYRLKRLSLPVGGGARSRMTAGMV